MKAAPTPDAAARSADRDDGFRTAGETAVADRFVADGYTIVDVEDRAALDRLRDHVAATAAQHLGMALPADRQAFLDGIADHVPVETLNDFRLAIIRSLTAEAWVRPAYFRLVRGTLETIVGSEIAMQKRINLSIQLPDDDSSLLPVHADVWSGDSPFEIVQWVPLVDVFGTKTMFLLPAGPNRAVQADFARFRGRPADDLFHAIAPDLVWMTLSYGQVILFTQNALHGNRVNREATTRWSMNCRFKGLFTPYADKRLGEFFEPVTMAPASRIGLDYRLPEGIDD